MDVVSGKRGLLKCRPCELTGTAVPSGGYCQDCQEYLCDECYKSHTKPAPCRHHVLVLLDKDHVSPSLPEARASPFGANDESYFCLQHVTQTVQYYCEVHATCICIKCLTTTHKGCKYGIIDELARSPNLQTEFHDTLNKADYLRRLCDVDIKASNDAVEEVNQVKTDIGEAIKTFRDAINARFDTMESSLRRESDQVFDDENKRLTDLVGQLNGVVKKIEDLENMLKGLNSDEKKQELFVKLKTASPHLNALIKQEKDINEQISIQALEFVPNTDLLDKLTKLQERDQLGDLVKERRTIPAAILAQRLAITETAVGQISKHSTVVLSHAGDLNVTSTSDNSPSNITGMACVDSDNIIVADNANKTVKRIDMRRNKVTTTTVLTNKPWDVTVISDQEIAVTVPDENMVQVMSVSDKLSLSRQFKTRRSCFGICYRDNKLYTTSYRKLWMTTACVVVYNLDGEVISQFDAGGMFREPNYVIANKRDKYLYVTDKTRESVTKLSTQGQLLGDYILKEPVDSGLHELNDGTMLVCSRRRGGIVRLSKKLMDGDLEVSIPVLKPKVVTYCDRSQRVFVGGHDNMINVFDVKRR